MCQRDAQCCSELICQKQSMYDVNGVCAAKLPAGAECHDNDQCQSNHCNMEWYEDVQGHGGHCDWVTRRDVTAGQHADRGQWRHAPDVATEYPEVTSLNETNGSVALAFARVLEGQSSRSSSEDILQNYSVAISVAYGSHSLTAIIVAWPVHLVMVKSNRIFFFRLTGNFLI